LGIGIKKAISFRGLDLRGRGPRESIHGCQCADPSWHKNELEYKLENNIRGPKALSDAFDARLQSVEAISKEIKTYCNANKDNPKDVATYLASKKSDLEAAKKELEAAKKDWEAAEKQRKAAKKQTESAKKNTLQKLFERRAKAKAMRPSYAISQGSYGFSGSLIFKKGKNGGYDVFGIYSGPLFTDEMKTFIEQAAAYQWSLKFQTLEEELQDIGQH
jgi:chemotaxis protein histidine kinase CheA